MNIDQIRTYINIINEDRNNDFEYQNDKTKVTANLRGSESASFTRLAKDLIEMEGLSKQIEELKKSVKANTKSNVADMFDASDAVLTRVIRTKSFVVTLSKDPEASTSYKYKEILDELTQHLTPELIKVLEATKKKFESSVNRSPTIKAEPIVKECIVREGIFSKFKMRVMRWAQKYDRKLDHLKSLAANLQ